MSEPLDVGGIELEDELWCVPRKWHERFLTLILSWDYTEDEIMDRVCGPEYRMALQGRPMT